MERDLEVQCPECEFAWESAFELDDNGYTESIEVCSKCNHEFSFSYDDDNIWDRADAAYDALMED